jgi:hypothetical protein
LEQSDGAYERNPQAIIIFIVSTNEEEATRMQENPILRRKGKYHSYLVVKPGKKKKNKKKKKNEIQNKTLKLLLKQRYLSFNLSQSQKSSSVVSFSERRCGGWAEAIRWCRSSPWMVGRSGRSGREAVRWCRSLPWRASP